MTQFASDGSKFVRKNGYVLMSKDSGHKMYWWDHDVWVERQKSFDSAFWDEYRARHKGTGDTIAQMVKQHFQAASKWDRMARNAPTQGSGAVILKTAMTMFYHWIIENKLFNKVKIVALVHDEACIEFPENMIEIPKFLETIMEEAASKYCHKLPIPAEASVGTHWIH